ncbi:MAG: hypothetical protein HY368_02550 [Candidatus Aenigmarchaeota archaeon]|nr:hypothetical protein [Candidatus Aenigmarchaeota archaeon]
MSIPSYNEVHSSLLAELDRESPSVLAQGVRTLLEKLRLRYQLEPTEENLVDYVSAISFAEEALGLGREKQHVHSVVRASKPEPYVFQRTG